MNNLEELEVMEMPVTMAQPLQASYLKQSRIPLGQLSRGTTSRTIRNNMRGIKFHKNTHVNIGVAINARNFAKHGTHSISPQPMKLGAGRSTARRASRHARRKHGRRYRSRHIRR